MNLPIPASRKKLSSSNQSVVQSEKKPVPAPRSRKLNMSTNSTKPISSLPIQLSNGRDTVFNPNKERPVPAPRSRKLSVRTKSAIPISSLPIQLSNGMDSSFNPSKKKRPVPAPRNLSHFKPQKKKLKFKNNLVSYEYANATNYNEMTENNEILALELASQIIENEMSKINDPTVNDVNRLDLSKLSETTQSLIKMPYQGALNKSSKFFYNSEYLKLLIDYLKKIQILEKLESSPKCVSN
jgi:hypothetical protein